MKKDRLLKLAEVLENFQEERHNLVVPLQRFDMTIWLTGVAMNGALHRHASCGTAACAMGTAALHPWFRERGLHVSMERDGSCFTSPRFGASAAFGAAADFFDIYHDSAVYLFDSDAYPAARRGPKSVAKRIRAFVETGVVPA